MDPPGASLKHFGGSRCFTPTHRPLQPLVLARLDAHRVFLMGLPSNKATAASPLEPRSIRGHKGPRGVPRAVFPTPCSQAELPPAPGQGTGEPPPRCPRGSCVPAPQTQLQLLGSCPSPHPHRPPVAPHPGFLQLFLQPHSSWGRSQGRVCSRKPERTAAERLRWR